MRKQEKHAEVFYRPELDVVRFVAFLLVFLFHALPGDPNAPNAAFLKGFAQVFCAAVNACRSGLCLFFSLSAFLICQLLVREKEFTGTVNVRQFYIRRILRIWPLYYFVLGVGTISVFWFHGKSEDLAGIGWFAIFCGSWFFASHGPLMVPVALSGLWSISVEEQFYVLVPWLIKYMRLKVLHWVPLILILITNCVLFWRGFTRSSDDGVWFNSLVQFECFAAGMLLCFFLEFRLPRLTSWQRILMLGCSAACWLFTSIGLGYPFDLAEKNPGSWHLIAAYALLSLGSVAILLAFLGLDPKVIPRWAIYLGKISFGLYVFHMLALQIVFDVFPPATHFKAVLLLLKLVLAFALSVLLAAISYRYIESQFLRLKKRYSVIATRPV